MGQAHVIVSVRTESSQSCDYHIDLLPVHLPTEVWLIEGDHQVYYSLQAATTSHHSAALIILMWLCGRIILMNAGVTKVRLLGHRLQGQTNLFKVWAPTAKMSNW